MTGDAPQPGETPRDDGTPWSHADPASPWWRPDEPDQAADRPRDQRRSATAAAAATSATPTLDPPQPAQHTGEAAVAHQAGAQDLLAALTGETVEAAVFTVPDHPPTEAAPAIPQPTDPKPAESRPAESRIVESRPVESGPAKSRPVESRIVESRPVESTPAESRAVKSRPVESGSGSGSGSGSVEATIADKPHTIRRSTPPRHAQAVPRRKADEHDHDRLDAERFNTEGDGTVYATRGRARPTAGPERETTITDLLNSIPVEPPRGETGPDVMVLPEPDRNRPTVSLDRNAVPGQPPGRPARPGRAGEDRARADRALQDRIRQERTAALLETSQFWRAEEQRREHSWSAPQTHERPGETGRTPRRHAAPPRRPFAGLLGMLVLGLVAAFFAWVSAEPFWLAVGHGDRGSATVERCTGSGVSQRCTGQFLAGDGAYRVDELALFGVEPGRRAPGMSSPARMVSSTSGQAYVGSTGVLLHLRWALSFTLVLICGLGIAGLTGARRLDSARARRGATLVSLAAPLVLLAGFLYAAY